MLTLLLGVGNCHLSAEPVDDYLSYLQWPDRGETAMLEFSEERSFPFRRFPKRYSGRMYRAPNGDLAIVYAEPRNLRLILVGNQVQLVDEDGAVKSIPSDQFDGRTISDLLRGDVERLKQDWNSESTDSGLRLSPKPESIAKSIDYIDINFASQSVQTITIHQSNQATRQYEFGEVKWISGEEAAAPFAAE